MAAYHLLRKGFQLRVGPVAKTAGRVDSGAVLVDGGMEGLNDTEEVLGHSNAVGGIDTMDDLWVADMDGLRMACARTGFLHG